MGYLHIPNLYKDQTILAFKQCYALEKIHGCLHFNTKILMSDGTQKYIFQIEPGERVISYNQETKQFEPREVKALLIQAKDTRLPWHIISLEDGKEIVCTEDHPFLTKNRGWVHAKDLTEQDDLVAISPEITFLENRLNAL